MKSALLAQILLVGSLLVLSVPSNIFHVAATPSYLPGVKQGDTITYGNVNSFWRANLTRTAPSPATSTISVQPNATIDLSRSMKQITVELALNNTPDVPPFNGIYIQLAYDHHVLTASSLDFSTNVLSQTGFSTVIVRDCLDGLPAAGLGTNACSTGDGPGSVTFAETIQGGDTSDGTQGNIFLLTLNVNTTAPSFSQIRIVQTILAEGKVPISTSNIDGYYTSLDCGGVACQPGLASFTFSPRLLKPGDIVSFDSSSSLPSPGSVITDHFWAFGDTLGLRPYRDSGLNSTTAYVYQLAGNYSVTLTITDSRGVRTFKTQVVEVVGSNPAGSPPFIAEFFDVQTIQDGVQSVAGNNVSISQTFFFKNITFSRIFLLSGNVADGSGNLAFWLLAGGLTAGNPIYNTLGAPTINSTDSELFAGALRQVNHLRLTSNGGAVHLNWAWDQATGILLSFDSEVFVQSGASVTFGNSNVSLTGTNVFTSASSPNFSLSVSPTLLTISKNVSLSLSFTVTVTSHNNFTAPVNGVVTVSPFGVVVEPPAFGMELSSNSSSSTTLVVVAASDTLPGTYLATVVASSGQLSQTSILTIIVLPSGDFSIQANPSDVVIHKSNTSDPFAFGTSMITLASIKGFSGQIQLQAGSALAQFGFSFSAATVNLAANSTADSLLTITAANVPQGAYEVEVIGTQLSTANTTFELRHSVLIRVVVFAPPPDFQIYLSVPFGGNPIFAGSSTVIGVQISSIGSSLFNGTVTLSGQVSPLINNGPSLSINPSSVALQFGFASSQLTISTTGLTPPGNYSITVKGTSGTPGTTGFLTHTAQLQLVVLPPPIITVNPSSGPIGTQVTVHGSGFVNPSQGPFSFPVEIQVTFDDQLIGLFFIQGSSFNFTFNIPVSQTGIVHQIHAKELFPSNLDVQASFLVLASPNNLSVTVSSGTIYFSGDTATIFAVTSINGQPAFVTNVQIILILPNGTGITIPSGLTSKGVYKATFAVPTRGAFGTYAVIATAHQTGSSDAFALTSFQVKPTWLQSNGRAVTTASIAGAVGVFGVVALAWQKGYLTNRKKDSLLNEESGI